MSEEKLIGILEKINDDKDDDRCQRCFSLLRKEAVYPSTGSPFMWISCTNIECPDSKQRKVFIK